ncbi:MAG: M3 family metallopeptidase [Myxococcota bacterium]
MGNPLVDLAFDLSWNDIAAEHVEPGIDALVTEAQAAVAAIGAPTTPRRYATTLGALEEATVKLGLALTVVGHLEAVRTTPELREAWNRARPKAAAFLASLPLDAALYAALREFAATPEAAALDAPYDRLLKKTLEEFERHGAALGDADKARLREVDVALTKVSTRFGQNVLDATTGWELLVDDEASLAGLPASARDAARQDAESRGQSGWRFTLQAPSYLAVMRHLDDGTLRERVWRAFNGRAAAGPKENWSLIAEILSLRAEKAALLGHGDFADFVLLDRMARSGGAAAAFVEDLRERTAPAAAAEEAELLAFRREREGPDAAALAPWDVAYYAEKLRKERFAFDDEALRPYFAVDHVLRGLFELVESLYGVRIEEREAEVWHPSVRCYGIYEGERLVAAFYVDLFPRDDKRGGAWMNPLQSGVGEGAPGQGELGPHLGLFCANVTPPLGDAPALLTHAEVETLFHEFGHLLHHAFSEVPVRSLGGTNVAWDFVELPSQIMENFCWERRSLDLFARHHETGEPIPDTLFDKLVRSRTYRAASAQMRQLGFAAVDLALHRDFDAKGTTESALRDFGNGVLQAYAPAPLPEDYAMLCAFTHLFASPTGYAAGYYSYKWAEVLDADAFTRFRDSGVISAEVGRAFRNAILARGDSDEPAALFERFMGRAPSLDALLERIGLAA